MVSIECLLLSYHHKIENHKSRTILLPLFPAVLISQKKHQIQLDFTYTILLFSFFLSLLSFHPPVRISLAFLPFSSTQALALKLYFGSVSRSALDFCFSVRRTGNLELQFNPLIFLHCLDTNPELYELLKSVSFINLSNVKYLSGYWYSYYILQKLKQQLTNIKTQKMDFKEISKQ